LEEGVSVDQTVDLQPAGFAMKTTRTLLPRLLSVVSFVGCGLVVEAGPEPAVKIHLVNSAAFT
jgi:hypothetical protein